MRIVLFYCLLITAFSTVYATKFVPFTISQHQIEKGRREPFAISADDYHALAAASGQPNALRQYQHTNFTVNKAFILQRLLLVHYKQAHQSSIIIRNANNHQAEKYTLKDPSLVALCRQLT